MKKALFLCICIGFTFASNAQTADKKWNIGLHGGVTQYSGDLGRDWYQTTNTSYGFGGISVSRYLGKLFDANLLLSKGTIGYNNGTTAGFKSDNGPSSFLHPASKTPASKMEASLFFIFFIIMIIKIS